MACNKETCSCKKKLSAEVCAETVFQIDSKEVFYKLKGDCFSNMNFLDIPKGSSVEYVLERFATFIENFSYFDVTPNEYNAPDLKTYMDALTLDVKLTKQCCEDKQQQINTLLQEIVAIKNRLVAIEQPQIVDSRGLGFTVNSSIKTVIQTLANIP